ncbi:B3 domain-containing protein Os03g0184500-like isoform X2 [Lycium ferocissimum]|uniref:B3 domain-containing protein Os03g0184500-like isoform X2 n=1 Tax=Lycium ferocissimum TaxID=112874 RepID=UPI0028159EB7|nr:B3 domain-containing protein Os03g0184500-like isoform X2 [Lycium ferocissimum]
MEDNRNLISSVKPVKKKCKEGQQKVKTHKHKATSHSSASTSTQTDPKPKIKTVELDRKKMVPKKPRSVKSKEKEVKSNHPTKAESNKRKGSKRTRMNDLYDDVEAKYSVLERAERVLSSLADEFPSFGKCMLPSNVAHGFWLHLPKSFCNMHLPSHDTTVILVDEWGNEYKTSYLLERNGLSAGWRGFSISHRLIKGDILIFRLIEPCKMKVYIVRVSGRDVVDAALCLMNLDILKKSMEFDLVQKDNGKRKKAKRLAEPSFVDLSKPKEHVQNDSHSAVDLNVSPSEHRSENNSEDLGSEVLEGSIAGSDVTNRLQASEICFSGTSFLHDNPQKSISCR